MQVIQQAAHECAQAAWGHSAGIVRGAALALNLSPQRAHALISAEMRNLGLAAPRKRRADAGSSAISEADLDTIAGVRFYDMRHGKDEITLQATIDMLHENGCISARLSASHVARLLRQRGLDLTSLTRPAAHVTTRVEHINQVWQIDSSTGVLWYAPGKGGAPGGMHFIEDGVHYKNKPENLVKVADKLLVRYIATEVASGARLARFYVGGETTENTLAFLMWAMTQRHGANGEPMPLHGVPFVIYTDQGPSFRSAPTKSFCSAMGIKQMWHRPRNSKATGSAEKTQDVFERGLESRLRFMDRASLSMGLLNAMAELWAHAHNGTHRHSRHGMLPYAAWSTIGSEHLRLAPSMNIMASLPSSLSETRTVGGDMRVSYEGAPYDVRYVPGVSPGDKVLVCVNPFSAPAVRVGVTDRETGEILWHEVQPLEKGWLGYTPTDPVQCKDGVGEYKAMPTTPADERRARIAAQAFAKDGKPATPAQVEAAVKSGAVPYQGQFDPLADLKAKAASLPHFLQRPGMPHEVAATSVEPERISIAAACQLMRQELGSDYDTGTYAWLSERYSEGVPRDVVQRLIDGRRQALQASAAPSGQPMGLRVVGSDL